MPDVIWLLLAVVAVVVTHWGWNRMPEEIEWNFSLLITQQTLVALAFGAACIVVVVLLLAQGA